MSLVERVYNYAVNIVEGNIKAGKKHIQACKRFLNDISKLENEDYPYYFDGNELYDFYEWAKLFKHREGILAGQPIELNDFQLFVVANIFCWKHKNTNRRRFKRVYIQLARKNAKSFLQSLIASYVAFLSDEKEQIYIAGVKKEQSKIVYDQILGQINNCKLLEGKFTTSYGRITVLKNDSVIRPLSKEDGKKGDGLFPSLAIIDELHLHKTPEVYDVMLSGMIGRKNALIVAITTAGLDLNTFGYREYQYASKVIDPESSVENDEYFVMICELDENDDIKDESNFIKANPVVATYEEGIEDLRSRLKVALDVPEKMIEFMTKHLNIWVQMKQNGYMDLSKWNECIAEEEIDLHNKEVYIGVDLSATLDLTSVSFLFPLNDGKIFVKSHSFIPEATLEEKRRTDKVPYDLWVKQGWITATEGEVIDYRYVQKYIIDEVNKNGWIVKEICFDEWNAQQFANEMSDEGFTMVKIIQGMKTLAPATKNFREMVYQKRILHDDNPVLNWAIGNAVTKLDVNGNFMLDKSKTTERIDPVASVINAHVRAMHHEHNTTVDLNEMVTDDFLDKIGW